MWAGTRRLLLNTLPSPVRKIAAGLSQQQKLTFGRTPHGSPAALLEDCVAAAVDELMRKHGGPASERTGFEALRTAVGQELQPAAQRIAGQVERVIAEAHQVELRLSSAAPPAVRPVLAEVSAQLRTLVYPGFVAATPSAQLPHLRRYLAAMTQRLDDAPTNLERDRVRQAQVDALTRDLDELRTSIGDACADEADPIRWMIEELRVSLFAQKLGTAHPVSIQRIHRAMDDIEESGRR
jgi:ATP-dependent helicase HrpA